MTEKDNTIESRLTEVEIKLTMLEDANEQMSEMMIRQQALIENLVAQLEMAHAQIQAINEHGGPDQSTNRLEVPPHY
ncbi:MAG: SlyX family protein [Pseudomonadota bacterium]